MLSGRVAQPVIATDAKNRTPIRNAFFKFLSPFYTKVKLNPSKLLHTGVQNTLSPIGDFI
jgi:hypothetical protein